jgi:hypothetical protein
MWEQAMSFTDLVSRYGLSRSEGVVLRYLSDAYRTLRQTVPEAHHSTELDDLIEWLGETIRQTDSSLLDEWEALTHPGDTLVPAHRDAAAPPRPLTANDRAFRAMVRRAMWRRVELAARDDVQALYAAERVAAALTDPPSELVMDAAAWDEALGGYWAEHAEVGLDADARGPTPRSTSTRATRWASWSC